MLRGIPRAEYHEIDQSSVPPQLLDGTHGVVVSTLFGPTDKPYEISTVDDLLSIFGGYDAVHAPFFPALKRAIARGTNLLIQRLVQTGAVAASHDYGNVKKVVITAKSVGAWANGSLGILYTPAGVGVQAQLSVKYPPNTTLEEVFSADTFDGVIALVNADSQRIQITTQAGYVELDDTAGVPVELAGGDDGAFANTAARDAAVNLLLANFNNFTDLDTIAVVGGYSQTHLANLKAYCETRADLVGLFEIDPALTPANALVFAQAIAVKSSFLAAYYSSLRTVYSPEAQADVSGPCILDVQAVYSFSDTVSQSRHRAPAGGKRGLLLDVKHFAYNMLSPSNAGVANSLYDLGINIVGDSPQFGPVVWGAKTLNNASGSDAFNHVNVRRLFIDLHKQLAPIFTGELFEPMDPTSWREAYGKAIVLLGTLEAKRAIYKGWTYNGDQEASKIQDARFNDPNDLAAGIYKVKISLVPVGYIQRVVFTVQANNLLTLFQTTATVVQ